MHGWLGQFGGVASSGGGSGSGDMLAAGLNAITSLINTDATLAYDTWHVVQVTANHTLTLPAPALSSGKPQLLGILIDPTSSKLVTLAPHGAETIDGASSRLLWAGESAVLLTDGSNWFKVAGKSRPLFGGLTLTNGFAVSASTFTSINVATAESGSALTMADTVNYQINILRDGVYNVACYVPFAADTSGTTGFAGAESLLIAYVQKNAHTSGTGRVLQSVLNAKAGDFASPAPASPLSLLANDYLALGCFVGSACDVVGGNFVYLRALEQPSW